MAGAAFVGCKSEEVDDKAPTVHTYAFDGKVDDRYVGDWHTGTNDSGLNMHKDGSVDIVAVASGPGGKVTKKLTGNWLISGPNLMIKYGPEKGEMPVVLKYAVDLSGDTMKVVQAGNNIKATYKRTPAKK